ncbi:MAG: hypothetical protein IJH84_03995, partial [Saccharopolyspora sp.]|uniref:hypothetical protein n=1 Tax=Saccharopolyspora sp. TaxID=33915 RepID=UPI0025F6F291
DVSINHSDLLRHGRTSKLDGVHLLSVRGLEHVRGSLRSLLHRSSGDPAMSFPAGANSRLIEQTVSAGALRRDRRALSRLQRISGLGWTRRLANTEGSAAVSYQLRDVNKHETVWLQPEESSTGTSTTGSERSRSWGWKSTIEPAFMATSETSGHSPGTTSYGFGMLFSTIDVLNNSKGRTDGHRSTITDELAMSSEPRRVHVISATLEATQAVETRRRGKLDRWNLFSSREVGRAAERFELPNAVWAVVDDQQLHELRIRQAEQDAHRAAEGPEPPRLPEPESRPERADLSPIPDGQDLGAPRWADGVIEPVDLSDQLKPLHDQLVRRLGQERADELLSPASQGTAHDNYAEAERYLSRIQASLRDLSNGGTSAPLRLEDRLRGETYELHVAAEQVGQAEPVGIKHGERQRATKASFVTSTARSFRRAVLEVFNMAIPSVMMQNDEAAASTAPAEHGAPYNYWGLGLGHAFEGLKASRNVRQDGTIEHTHTETVRGALAEHRVKLLFDLRIERHGERIAAAPDTRTVTTHTPVEDAIPGPAGSRSGEIHRRSADDAGAAALAGWRADAVRLPNDPAKWRAIDFGGDVRDLVRGAERTLEEAGVEVDAHTRRMLRAALTSSRATGTLGSHGSDGVPLDLPSSLGVELTMHPKATGPGELAGASGRIGLGGESAFPSSTRTEHSTATGNSLSALPFAAFGVPQHPDAASYPNRELFGQAGDWVIPNEPLGAKRSEQAYQGGASSGGRQLPAHDADPSGITSTWSHGAGYRFVATPTSKLTRKRPAVVDVEFEQGFVLRRGDVSGALPASLITASRELAARDAEWQTARARRRAADPS